MTCAELEMLILDRIDGQLDRETASLVEVHLTGCENCRAFAAAQAELDQELIHFAEGVKLSPRFRSGVLQHVKTKPWALDLVHLDTVGDLAGLVAVAAAGAFCLSHWLPSFLLGGPWVAAAVILCSGAYFVLAEPEAPSAKVQHLLKPKKKGADNSRFVG